MGLQVNYVRKWGRDFARLARRRRHLRSGAGRRRRGQRIQPTGTINIFRLTSDPGARKFELANSDGVFTDIHAVTANLTKRMTRWYANAGVTYLRAEGAVGGSCKGNEHSAAERPGVQPFGRNPNDFVNVAGRLNGDVGWQYKLQAVVRLPLGFQASASLDSHEGAHRIRTRTIPASVAGQSSTILLQPRGELGRLPSVTIIDARLQKEFPLGRGARARPLPGRVEPEQRELTASGGDRPT